MQKVSYFLTISFKKFKGRNLFKYNFSNDQKLFFTVIFTMHRNVLHGIEGMMALTHVLCSLFYLCHFNTLHHIERTKKQKTYLPNIKWLILLLVRVVKFIEPVTIFMRMLFWIVLLENHYVISQNNRWDSFLTLIKLDFQFKNFCNVLLSHL